MIPKKKRRGLYVHIPFCAKKCHYCDFVITLKHSSHDRSRFFEALELEIAQARETYGELTFDTLYLGGGTPSLLTEQEISALAALLRKNFHFREGFEFTIEMNPDDANVSLIAVYKSLGMNRVSVGAQSTQDALLKSSGRIHNAHQTTEAMGMLREAGFSNISMDFILNLPAQTLEDVSEAVRYGVDQGAAQMVLYDLDVHERTVFGAWRRRGMLSSVDEESHQKMWQSAADLLESEGYSAYELSSYAKPGFESRHNLIYWHNQEYLGLGPGAFSYMNKVRYQFAEDVRSYVEKCFAQNWQRAIEDHLSPRQIEIETFLTGLRLKEGIDLNDFPLIAPEVDSSAEALYSAGFLNKAGSLFWLEKKGLFVANQIFSVLVQNALPDKNAKAAS